MLSFAAAMSRYDWKSLNKQQVGAYAEYFVKMELTMRGFQVYRTEVDDRGIDFVARYQRGPFFPVQVKSVRGPGYVFAEKAKFPLTEPNLHLALAIFRQGEPPELFMIPATAWSKSTALFADRDYEGRKSKPEYGINLSKRNLPALADYRFDRIAGLWTGPDTPANCRPPT